MTLDIEKSIKELALQDAEFKANLMSNPKETIENRFNIKLDDDIDIQILEDEKKVHYILLPHIDEGDEYDPNILPRNEW